MRTSSTEPATHRWPGALVGLVFAAWIWPSGLEAQPPVRPEGMRASEHRVAMRDGVHLLTTVYLPEGEGPWPVILTRTPYNQAGYWRRAARYLEGGYAFVTQDCRGRFGSEGVYEPYQTDLEDGHDTVEWIAQQPFANGKVGISGRSAMAIAANLAAAAAPPHLVAAYAVTAPESLFDESYFMGGIFREHFRGNFMRLQGAEDQIPILKARAVLDEQWLRSDLLHHRHRTRVPVYQVGGWFDMFAKGAVRNFQALQHEGPEGARGKQRLWMGPWGHSPIDGDLEYPGARGLDRGFEDELRWFDYWLKGIDDGVGDEPAVTYYHMAAARKGAPSTKNGLRTAADWPPPCPERDRCFEQRLYLRSDRTLSFEAPAEATAATTYRFDPAQPVPTLGGANYNNFAREFPITVGPVDQRALGERPDYLRFHSAPLEQDLTIQGRVEAELYVSTDAPDTDIMVKLVDVYPDGYQAILLDSPLRLRYRNGRRTEDVAMMTPGEVVRVVIDLWDISQTFEQGHQIGVHVSSSNDPRFEVNANNGEPAGQSRLPPRIAANTIHHDAAYPSALVLPVMPYPERD